MATPSHIGPISQQYAAAATVPLVKSPSLWLPPPVEMPKDIHPLPDDITAYFVYPFTLEEHVVGLHPTPHQAIAERRTRLAALLVAREEEEEKREKAELHRLAPGYNPNSVLAPTHGEDKKVEKTETPAPEQPKEVDPMDELVAQLQEMEQAK